MIAKIKPVKPGFLTIHKPGFTGLKIGGLPGFSGTRVSFPRCEERRTSSPVGPVTVVEPWPKMGFGGFRV